MKGGWDIARMEDHLICRAGVTHDIEEKALLDPLAWQAVGKTRKETWGWTIGTADIPQSHVSSMWASKWQCFIGHLVDGLNIEEALSKLEN